MKLTKTNLKLIIREELGRIQQESFEEEMAAWMDATSKKRQRKMAELGGKIKELGDQLDRTVNQEERGEILKQIRDLESQRDYAAYVGD